MTNDLSCHQINDGISNPLVTRVGVKSLVPNQIAWYLVCRQWEREWVRPFQEDVTKVQKLFK